MAVQDPGAYADTSALGKPVWTVDRVSDTTSLSAAGVIQRNLRVDFSMADGTSSYVEVPVADATPERVKRQINEHALKLAGIMDLKGDQI